MFFTLILALTDFSADGDKALARAGQIARGHGAALWLAHLPGARRPLCADPSTRLDQTARAMASRLGIAVHTAGTADQARPALPVQAGSADLLVVPQCSAGLVQRWLGEPQAITFMRQCRCPVLVARGAVRRQLRRIVVGVDFTPAADHRALFACLLERDAEVELFHAVDTYGEVQLRQAEVDGDVLRNYRDGRMEQACLRLSGMARTLRAQAHCVEAAARRGTPAQQLLERQAWVGADLLVVGKQRRHRLVDLLLRSTAHRLLEHARCDVLLVPHDYAWTAARAAAAPPAPPDAMRTAAPA